MRPNEWFRDWLKSHKKLHPNREWSRYESAGFATVYRGWVRAFRVRGVTRHLADLASVRMQAEPPLYPEKHLARVLRLAAEIRSGEEIDAQARSWQKVRARARAEEELQERLKKLFATLPAEEQERNRGWVRANHPDMARFPAFVEYMARNRWADLVRAQRMQTVGV